MRFYCEDTEAVLHDVGSTSDGLTTAEAEKRLAENGKNKLAEGKKDSLVKRFFQQMGDPMIIILLVAAAISGVLAVVQGESFADVIIILAVVIINAVLGVYQESKAEKAIEALQQMSAATSKVLRDGKLVTVHSEDLVVGDVVVLEAGDAIPADGRILTSASMKIEEAALTGESVPGELRPGDRAVSGSVNLSGVIKINVEQVFGESTVSKILDLVENSSAKKAKTENFVTRFARVYTPAVVAGAVLLAFLPPLILRESVMPWIQRALTFLVVSCPCALVVSVPLSFFGLIVKSKDTTLS